MKISIITPSFKQLEFLKCCVASVADQEGGQLVEHIIQDGKSGAEFDDWAKGQNNTQVYSESDLGMYDAINRGFEKSKGDVVCWLNCDEQYLPGTLERVARYFNENPEVDILFGDVILVDSKSEPLAYRRIIKPSRQHLRHCFLSTLSAATFVRRRVINAGHKLNTDFKAISDIVWIHELLEQGYRMEALKEPLSSFCMTGENLGLSGITQKEEKIWRASLGIKDKFGFKRQFYGMLYRVRKLVQGGYSQREISVQLFKIGQEQRKARLAKVGGRWASVRSLANQARQD